MNLEKNKVRVKLNYLRIAPRKVRLVADLIRGKSVKEADGLLRFTIKKSSPIFRKMIKSAIASAKQQLQLDEENLYISLVKVDEGPKLKRWMPRARGSAYPIHKKTSHITLELKPIKNSINVKKDKNNKTKKGFKESVSKDNKSEEKENNFKK
jgi:large subunit ribosomal protein L22